MLITIAFALAYIFVAVTSVSAVEPDGTILPAPEPAFAGKIGKTFRDSTPDWTPALPI